MRKPLLLCFFLAFSSMLSGQSTISDCIEGYGFDSETSLKPFEVPDSLLFGHSLRFLACYIQTYPENANPFIQNWFQRIDHKLSTEERVELILDAAYMWQNYEHDSIAFSFIDSALQISLSQTEDNLSAKVYHFKATAMANAEKRYSAMPYLDSALAHLNIPDPKLKASILVDYGRYNYDVGDYSNAMRYYTEARDLFESNGILSPTYGNLMHYIGSVFKRQYDDSTAALYYWKMVHVGEQIKDSLVEAEGYYLLSDIYGYAGDLENELGTLHRALKIYEALGDNRGTVQCLLAIAHAYIYSGDDDLAIEYSFKALDKNNDESTTISFNANRYLGRLYARKGNFKEAQRYFSKALEIAEKTDEKRLINLRNLHYSIAFAYVKEGDWQSAFRSLEQYIYYQDTLVMKENRSVVFELEQRYEKDKKEAEIVSLNKDKEIAKKEAARQRVVKNAFIAGFLLVLLVVFITVFSRQRILHKNRIISLQKKEVEEKNEEIMASITYAKKLQTAVLPPTRVVKEFFSESFLLYLPRDIVSGDFYWMESNNDVSYFAVADCTGHGVPGAMLSVIGMNGLNRALNEQGLTAPKDILTSLSEHIQKHFEQSEATVRDGMDICLCALDNTTMKLTYAGANNPVWIARNGEMHILKADRRAIGHDDQNRAFTQQEFQLQKEDTVYLSSDGFQDQLGGTDDRKYMTRRFRERLLVLSTANMEEQRQTLLTEHEKWKGTNHQTDDICVMGIRVV